MHGEQLVDLLLGLLLTIGGFVMRQLHERVRDVEKSAQNTTDAARDFATLSARIDRERSAVSDAMGGLREAMENQHRALSAQLADQAGRMEKTDAAIFSRLNEIADRLPSRGG